MSTDGGYEGGAAGGGGDRGFWEGGEQQGEADMNARAGRDGDDGGVFDGTSGGYARGGGSGGPAGLLEEEDETEWMAGEDVDPEAEAIFFGEKVPFSDLGELIHDNIGTWYYSLYNV